MQCSSLFVGEIVTFVVDDKLDDSAFGQSGRLVKNETSFLNARSQRIHATTVRFFAATSKPTNAMFVVCRVDRIVPEFEALLGKLEPADRLANTSKFLLQKTVQD